MTKRDSKGKFVKGATGNAAGRPVGTSINQKIRKSIAEDGGRLLDAIKQAAFDGDMAAAKILIDRLSPTLKPTGQTLELPGLASDNLSDRAKATLDAVARGEVTPDDASTIINSVAGLARISELTELEARIKQLEEAQNHD